MLPLPAHDLKDYDKLPRRLQDDPVYRRHARDWQTYHTRYVTPRRFRDALRPSRDALQISPAGKNKGEDEVAKGVEAHSMKSHIPRVVLIVFFAALLATPMALKRFKTGGVAVPNNVTGDAAGVMRRYGFHLQEVSKSAGIDFTHQAPKLDPQLEPIMPQIASMGAGVAVGDFDRDGWQDIYVTNSGEGSLNHLYRNKGDGSFENVAAKMGAADLNKSGTGVSMGAVWGDYDNDGWEDLFVYKWGRPELLRNNGGKSFSRVTERAGLPQWVNANSAVWLDFDRDGKLDLFVGGYYPDNVDLWKLKNTLIMPDSFEYATNGGGKYLLRGRGDGTFQDVSEERGVKSNRWALSAIAADLRETGYPDLFVANDYGYSELFANQKGRGFRDMRQETLYWDKLGTGPKSGMNASVGDISNSGRFAIYVSNITEASILNQRNNLWVPREGTSGDKLRYDNLADQMGVGDGGWSFGAQFGDLNNDGTLDLYLTNGYISADKDRSYWYDYSKISGGNSAIIADAKHWPPMKGQSLSGFQRKRVWLNDGAGKFSDVAQAVGASDLHDGRAVAMADLWNRGVLDVLVANQKGPLLLYKNTVAPENKWIEFALEGKPGKSNRSAIGAQVRVFWNGRQQLQEVAGASGFCAQNGRRLHFGLGTNPRLEKVTVRWPSGTLQTLTPAQLKLGEINTLKEAA